MQCVMWPTKFEIFSAVCIASSTLENHRLLLAYARQALPFHVREAVRSICYVRLLPRRAVTVPTVGCILLNAESCPCFKELCCVVFAKYKRSALRWKNIDVFFSYIQNQNALETVLSVLRETPCIYDCQEEMKMERRITHVRTETIVAQGSGIEKIFLVAVRPWRTYGLLSVFLILSLWILCSTFINVESCKNYQLVSLRRRSPDTSRNIAFEENDVEVRHALISPMFVVRN